MFLCYRNATSIPVFNTMVVCNDNQYEAGLLDSGLSKIQTEMVEIQAGIYAA